MVQYTPPYNRPRMLRALKGYGQRGGIIAPRRPFFSLGFKRRRRVNPKIPKWYKRQLLERKRRRSR